MVITLIVGLSSMLDYHCGKRDLVTLHSFNDLFKDMLLNKIGFIEGGKCCWRESSNGQLTCWSSFHAKPWVSMIRRFNACMNSIRGV